MAHLVRARLTRLAQVNFASMKCVVALALAFTAQAIDIDWRIPVAQPSVTVDKATDATITFKWSGFHSVFELPSKAAMDSCDFTDAHTRVGRVEAIRHRRDARLTADPRRYHVLSGKVLSSDLEVGMEPKTLEGSTIEVTSLTPPTINGDSVIGPADVLATNGVIHVIDTVLIPGDEPTMGPTAMEESDSAGRASLAVAAAAAVAYVL